MASRGPDWLALPNGAVLRLEGVTPEELAVALDPSPAGLPVVIRYRPPREAAPAIVDDVLKKLEAVSRQVFPAWLPEAADLGHSDLDRRAVRSVARARAARSGHFGPYLADLAEAALTGERLWSDHTPEIRARGVVRVLGDTYDRPGVALLVDIAGGDAHTDLHSATALGWLADHGGLGVWLLPGTLPTVDRFPTVPVVLPGHVRELAGERLIGGTPATDYPPPQGCPHPASAAEQALECVLARCGWAEGRAWNQTHQSHPLARLIRVDLIWRDARCVVELDGPDHRGALKFADDRRRDNALVEEGFVVLRFTNEDVADDMSRVVGIIERVVSSRREGR